MFSESKFHRSGLLLGIFFVCIIPSMLLPYWPRWPGNYRLMHVCSICTVALGFVCAMTSLQQFNSFPGFRFLAIGLPLLLFWYAVFSFVLFTFRLPYSFRYIFSGLLLSFIWLMLQTRASRRSRLLHLAFVPLGRAVNLNEISGAVWLRLEQPQLPKNQKLHAIVVDLHAPTLTDEWQRFLAECTLQHLPVYNVRQVEESLTGRVKIRHIYENDLGALLPSLVYMRIKYVLEVLLVLISLPLTLPIMFVTALAIKIGDGGRVFYNQERVGYRGRPFLMYKFRSMTECPDLNWQQETDLADERITKVGRFIRKNRIDELPQIFNVLKGEMSLIGPRAEYKKFADELEKQVPFYQYRHIVKPGISGWAQVMHGYAVGADKTQIKIEHDFYYIKNFSFWLDVLIFFKTFRIIITGWGAR